MGGFTDSRITHCGSLHDNGTGQERDAEFDVELVLVVGESNIFAQLKGPTSARNRHGPTRRTDCEQLLTGVIGGQKVDLTRRGRDGATSKAPTRKRGQLVEAERTEVVGDVA
jgi:hypothetical protein